jgi:hypothetical protein
MATSLSKAASSSWDWRHLFSTTAWDHPTASRDSLGVTARFSLSLIWRGRRGWSPRLSEQSWPRPDEQWPSRTP